MSRNRETVKLIDRAYTALDTLNDLNMTHYRDKIFKISERQERQHRCGYPEGSYLCTVKTAAQMHVVRWIVYYVQYPHKLPHIRDTLHLREDVILCAAVAAQYPDVIHKALQDFDYPQLLEIDYVELANGTAP